MDVDLITDEDFSSSVRAIAFAFIFAVVMGLVT